MYQEFGILCTTIESEDFASDLSGSSDANDFIDSAQTHEKYTDLIGLMNRTNSDGVSGKSLLQIRLKHILSKGIDEDFDISVAVYLIALWETEAYDLRQMQKLSKQSNDSWHAKVAKELLTMVNED